MKPHEETWLSGLDGDVYDPLGRRVASIYPNVGDARRERSAFIAAAPEMARALLSARACRNQTGLCPLCEAAIEKALTIAGVLL